MKVKYPLVVLSAVFSLFLLWYFISFANEYRSIKRVELSRTVDLSRILKYTDSKSPAIRLAALRCAYRSRGEQSPGIVQKSFETDPANRLEAAWALRYFPELHEKLTEYIASADNRTLKAVLVESYGFNLSPGEAVQFLKNLDGSPRVSRAVFISLGNLLRTMPAGGTKSILKRRLNAMADSQRGSHYLYALSSAGFTVSGEKKLMKRFGSMGSFEKYYFAGSCFLASSRRRLLDVFEDLDTQQKIAFAGNVATEPYFRRKLFAISSDENLISLLIAREDDVKRLKLLLDGSSPSIKEACISRLLELGNTDDLLVMRDLPSFRRMLNVASSETVSSLYDKEGLIAMTRDPDHIIRENGYSFLWELYPQEADIPLGAISDPDFSIRLTGYYMLYERDRELFFSTVSDNFSGEKESDVREFLLDMVREAQNSALYEKLLSEENDDYILKRNGRVGRFPVKMLKYRNGDYNVRITTDRGDIVIRCFGEAAPHNVENFIRLVKGGFYEGIVFHRVALNHVIQAGDPHGDGRGGSGVTAMAEYSMLTYDEPGMVGIADRGMDTGSSQFFINLTPRYHLNGRYTIIGRVIEGMDVVNTIRRGDRILSTAVLRTR